MPRCRDQKPLGWPCRQRPAPCCPGRVWDSQVCGCVASGVEVPQPLPSPPPSPSPQQNRCYKVQCFLSRPRNAVDPRLCGATGRPPVLNHLCPRPRKPFCVNICPNNAATRSGSFTASQFGQGLATGAQTAVQNLYGLQPGQNPLVTPVSLGAKRSMPAVSPAARSLPAATAGSVGAGVAGIGNVLFPGIFGQLDRRHTTLPDIRFPFLTTPRR